MILRCKLGLGHPMGPGADRFHYRVWLLSLDDDAAAAGVMPREFDKFMHARCVLTRRRRIAAGLETMFYPSQSHQPVIRVIDLDAVTLGEVPSTEIPLPSMVVSPEMLRD
jgi:hypothetical protein